MRRGKEGGRGGEIRPPTAGYPFGACLDDGYWLKAWRHADWGRDPSPPVWGGVGVMQRLSRQVGGRRASPYSLLASISGGASHQSLEMGMVHACAGPGRQGPRPWGVGGTGDGGADPPRRRKKKVLRVRGGKATLPLLPHERRAAALTALKGKARVPQKGGGKAARLVVKQVTQHGSPRGRGQRRGPRRRWGLRRGVLRCAPRPASVGAGARVACRLHREAPRGGPAARGVGLTPDDERDEGGSASPRRPRGDSGAGAARGRRQGGAEYPFHDGPGASHVKLAGIPRSASPHVAMPKKKCIYT